MKQDSSTVKMSSFELGGIAPFIMLEDALVEKAVAGVLASEIRSSG